MARVSYMLQRYSFFADSKVFCQTRFGIWIFAFELSSVLGDYAEKLHRQVSLLEASQEDSKYCIRKTCESIARFKGKRSCWPRKLCVKALHGDKVPDAHLEKLVGADRGWSFWELEKWCLCLAKALAGELLHRNLRMGALVSHLLLQRRKLRPRTRDSRTASAEPQLQIHTCNTMRAVPATLER